MPPIDSPLAQAALCFGNLIDQFNRLQTRLYEFAIEHDSRHLRQQKQLLGRRSLPNS
jgi:hypothetical protein